MVLLLVALCAIAATPSTTAAAPSAPGELLVRFDPSLAPSERADVRRRAGTPVQRALPLAGLQLVTLPSGAAGDQARTALERSSGVLYAEPNYERSLQATPDDTHFGLLWGLHNTGQTMGGVTGTVDADIDAPEAWDITTGSSATTVAVVDTGIDDSHPDLGSPAWSNPGETGAGRETNGIDDDQNGYVDDSQGWDWVEQDNDPADENGHGTHVAGTVSARGNNGQGVTGVSWQSKLMALRVLDADGEGTVADVVDGYSYAAAQGAPIVNASLGSTGFSFTEYDMLRSLPGTLFVVAAGNDGESNESNPHYPCSYDLANIVCVAASDNRDGLASFSNYGATSVDLAAPGRRILSTWPGGYTLRQRNVDGDAACVGSRGAGSRSPPRRERRQLAQLAAGGRRAATGVRGQDRHRRPVERPWQSRDPLRTGCSCSRTSAGPCAGGRQGPATGRPLRDGVKTDPRGCAPGPAHGHPLFGGLRAACRHVPRKEYRAQVRHRHPPVAKADRRCLRAAGIGTRSGRRPAAQPRRGATPEQQGARPGPARSADPGCRPGREPAQRDTHGTAPLAGLRPRGSRACAAGLRQAACWSSRARTRPWLRPGERST